jgi:AraC-like DNA-binding protein
MSSRLSIMRGRALHAGSSESVRSHCTPVYKLVVGVDAPVRFESGAGSATATALLVPPGVAHALRTEGYAVGLFLEAGGPLTPFAPREQRLCVLERPLAQRLHRLVAQHAEHGGRDDAALVDESFSLLRLGGPHRLDARIGGLLERIAHEPDLSIQALAQGAGLSPERLRHLVVERTGLPLRALRLFQRTLLAIEHLLRGRDPARAAALAGFADQAHFSRSFARQFGRTPSSVPRTARLIDSWASRS